MTTFLSALDQKIYREEDTETTELNKISDEDSKQLFELFYDKIKCRDSEGMIELLRAMLHQYKNTIDINRNKNLEYISDLFCLIEYTRDILYGEGQYKLAYDLILGLYEFFPNLALYAAETFVIMPDKSIPYGSWKDMKYLSRYVLINTSNIQHPIIKHCVKLIVFALKKDQEALKEKSNKISLVSKWCPREKSSYKVFHRLIVREMYSEYFDTAHTEKMEHKAYLKACTNLRKLLSSLNKYLDTLEIKMCDKKGEWSNIDFNKVSYSAKKKYKSAFKKRTNTDRTICANNFEKYTENKKEIYENEPQEQNYEGVINNVRYMKVKNIVKNYLQSQFLDPLRASE